MKAHRLYKHSPRPLFLDLRPLYSDINHFYFTITVPALWPSTLRIVEKHKKEESLMASPYILNNVDLQFVNCAGQDFNFYMAFLNPVSITTNWNDLNVDNQGNWKAPPNYDTLSHKVQPYAPTANLGPNRIGFVGEALYFDGTRSCQRFDLPVNTYSWSVTGSPTQITYHNGSQIGLSWASPGLYTVSLTVTDQFGGSTTGIRQVTIYQDRSSALPGVISISGLSGSLSSGGWQFQVTTVNSQVTLYPPDQLAVGTYQAVVLLCETRYEVAPGYWVNATLGPLGNFSPGYPYSDPRVFFDGYVQNGSYHQDIDKDTLSFTCGGPQMILQESQTHQIGYYNCAYSGHNSHGIPTGCKTSPAGTGFQVGNLMSADVIHSLLQTHCSIGTYHDIHVWDATIPTTVYKGGGPNSSYNLVYTTLSVNTGTIWQNITDITTNEWAQVYCERNGSINVGPQVNYRGSDYWQSPTLLGNQASSLINLVQDLGLTVTISNNDMTTINNSIPTIPAQPMPVQFVHPWGSQPVPTGVVQGFGQKDPNFLSAFQTLNGPPSLCVFSDSPQLDTGTPLGQNILFPWTQAKGPQDLAVYPISFDINLNYTGLTSLVKLVGTLYGHTTLWTSWYPQSAFQVTGDGTAEIVTSVLPAGNWIVDESHLLADITSNLQRNLMINWWWEIARRVWYAANIHYVGSITCGMFTACSLGDIVGITRQNNTLGPHWTQKPFYVTEISYNIDLTARTWTTVLTVNEVTSILLGPIVAPPKKLPKS